MTNPYKLSGNTFKIFVFLKSRHKSDEFFLLKDYKEKIAEETNLRLNTLNNIFMQLTHQGFIQNISRGKYKVNE